MGKNGTKRYLKNKAVERVADVTLDDCANNPRKIQFSKVKVNLKNIGKSSSPEPIDFVGDSDSDENIPNLPTTQKSQMPAKKGKSTSFGTVYPSDVWFYIARYIPPEDLSRFALICKDAYRVMLSVQYWKELCKRYKGDETTLPRELQSPCDSRRGLRARAIRLMFLRCPALIKSIKPPVAARYEPYTLHGMRLLLAWHEKEGSNWNFYFKWISRHINEHNHQRGELFENPEAGCRVLKATCNEFICFPYPQYCYLSSIHLGLTSDMRHQKLSLGFNDYTTTHCTARMKQTLGRGSVVQNRIDLEPIAKCILMDWWHPEYPYPREHSRPSVLPCPTEEW